MAHPVDLHVGRRVREARRDKGLTQTELGKTLGVSFQQIQKYEQGTNRIGPGRLWLVSKTLERPITWFYEGYEDAVEPEDFSAPPPDVMETAALIEQIPDPAFRKHILALVSLYLKDLKDG